MKRVLIIFSLLIAATLFAHAQMHPDRLPPLLNEAIAGPPMMLQVAGTMAAAEEEGCTWATSSDLTAAYAAYDVTSNRSVDSDSEFQCNKFVATTGDVVTGYIGYVTDHAGGGNGVARLALYADNGSNQPNLASMIADTNVEVDVDDMNPGDSYANFDFVLTTPKSGLTNGTTYWYCLSLYSGSDWFYLAADNAVDAGDNQRLCYTEDTGSNWTCVDNAAMHMKVRGCSE